VSNNPSTTSTDLAVDRTRLAHERTLMAWVRTSASLISFGFTIYKFFQYLREQQHNAVAADRIFGPREFAMALVIIGLTALVLATIQHRRDLVVMRKHYPDVPYSLATVVGGLVAILGVVTFTALVLRK
jgi:inner membrane protein YidH